MKTSKIAAAAMLAAGLFVIGCDEDATKKAAENTSDAAKKVEDGAKKVADDTGKKMDEAGTKAADGASAVGNMMGDAGNKMADMAGDAKKKMMEAMGGDPSELLKKAETLIGEGKLPDAKAILEKIKPYVEKLPADLQPKAKELLGKVGL